jgi:hypothetical protein
MKKTGPTPEQLKADEVAIIRGMADLPLEGPRPSRKARRRRRAFLVWYTEQLRTAPPTKRATLRRAMQERIDRAKTEDRTKEEASFLATLESLVRGQP